MAGSDIAQSRLRFPLSHGREYQGTELATSLNLPRGNFACVQVEDNGIGMDEEISVRAFEPFYTTKEKEVGSGLGLSTAHGIIEQSVGAIAIKSQTGWGTTVSFYLPITNLRAQDSEQSGLEEAPVQSSETTLLVEDENEVRRLAQISLETGGYHVVTAANGEET